MKHPQRFHAITVNVRGIEVVCHDVKFYEYEPANEIDPPDQPFAEWEFVTIGGVEVQELFHGELAPVLQAAVVDQLEATV